MLPAGDLGEHQKTQPVALGQEVVALGIVGGAHGVAAQLLLQNPGILPLQGGRGGVAHVGVALVPVQTPQESLFAVEIEPVCTELGGAEAHLCFLHVHDLADFQQGHPAVVENGPLRVPGLDHGTGDGHGAPGLKGLLHQQPLPLGKLHQQDAPLPMAQGGTDFQGFHIRGGDVQILNVGFFLHIQPNLPVQAAVGQVVHRKAEGGNLGILPGVQLHRQQIFPAQVGFPGDFHPEAGIAAAVLGQRLAVEEHRGDMPRPVKLQKQPLPRQLLPQFQPAPIAADHLVSGRIGIMQRQLLSRMRQPHRLPGPHPQSEFLRPLGNKFPTIAQTQHPNALLFVFR